MRAVMVALLVVAATALGGSLEAATGGGVVRAAVRLRAAVDGAGSVPQLQQWLAAETTDLVATLRAARRTAAPARRVAYADAGRRLAGLEAVIGYAPAAERERLMAAARVLERALGRASRCRRDRQCGVHHVCARSAEAAPRARGQCATLEEGPATRAW